MDGNIDIYCEIGFLEKFIEKCPQTNNGIPHKDYKYWQSYFELLCGESDVVLMDFGDKELRDLNDDNPLGQAMTFLLESHADGVGNLVLLPQESKNMKLLEQDNEGELYFNNHEQTIFLLDRDVDSCNKMGDDYGLLFISPDSLYKSAEFLFIPQREEINKNTKDHWDLLKYYRHPCHSIYLIDNYILGKESAILERNIKSLFDALLPLNLNKRQFSITIKTEIPEKHDETWTNTRCEKVKEWIRELRSNYSINVTIYYTTNENHDRNLFTNYFLFDSGYGFVLTNEERRKGTKITIFPITHSSSLTIMQNLKN